MKKFGRTPLNRQRDLPNLFPSDYVVNMKLVSEFFYCWASKVMSLRILDNICGVMLRRVTRLRSRRFAAAP